MWFKYWYCRDNRKYRVTFFTSLVQFIQVFYNIYIYMRRKFQEICFEQLKIKKVFLVISKWKLNNLFEYLLSAPYSQHGNLNEINSVSNTISLSLRANFYQWKTISWRPVRTYPRELYGSWSNQTFIVHFLTYSTCRCLIKEGEALVRVRS